MDPIRIEPLSRAGLNDFFAAARRAQAVNPQWIEPAHDEIEMLFDARKAPFARDNEIEAFVAYRDGEPVGRIAAIVNRDHIAKYNDACGQFGFIDAIDDADVFAALFAAAEGFLRERGMRRVRGPFSLTINQESGLLVEGFDQAHVIGTNHAPPFFGRQIEALGYTKAIDLVALTCRVADAHGVERIAKQAKRRKAPQFEIYNLSYRKWSRDLPRIISIYNDAWSDNLWSVTIGPEEAALIGRLMLPVCKPSWIRIARHNGEDVALMAQIPDVNEALKGLNGRMWPFNFLKVLWRLHVKGVKRSRIAMAGVAKKWRDTPLSVFAIGRLLELVIEDARKAGVEEIECSWILETNHAAINSVSHMPASVTRRFRIYEKAL